ncbi:MAG: S41 family peptidase [Bacteroidales bacterium]|nr:S41 family peptidase [Bacteroidales bacterium]
MQTVKKLIGLILLLPAILSCEKIFLDDSPENTPMATFEVCWKELDEHYAYFTMKNIHWDSLYHVYKALIYDQMEQYELWDVLHAMLCELHDGHVNLIDGERWSHWSECNGSPRYPEYFDFDLISYSYFKYTLKSSGPLLYGIIDSVGYIYYSSFTMDISDEEIDFVINLFKDMKGIIIDIRNNGGGDSENITRIQSRIVTKKTLVELIYYKTGTGHADFSAAQEVYVSPEGKLQFTGPVVVLTNRYCFSSANMFVSRMSVLPNVNIVGDTTGGGGGKPRFFDLPNGWAVRYSSNYALRPDGLNLENGVPPDFRVTLWPIDKRAGRDTLIEFALLWIYSQ